MRSCACAARGKAACRAARCLLLADRRYCSHPGQRLHMRSAPMMLTWDSCAAQGAAAATHAQCLGKAAHAPRFFLFDAAGSCCNISNRSQDLTPSPGCNRLMPVLPLWGHGAQSANRAVVALLPPGIRGLLLLLGSELPLVSKDCSQMTAAGT